MMGSRPLHATVLVLLVEIVNPYFEDFFFLIYVLIFAVTSSIQPLLLGNLQKEVF
jgi:hypothetical protein